VAAGDDAAAADGDDGNWEYYDADEDEELAQSLEDLPDTYVLIEGHTDAIGSESYNRLLSLKRAEKVADYLRTQQVLSDRLVVKGYGEAQPITTNETAAGQQANRRVEIAIYANEAMQQAARNGSISLR
ncbi:MAG: OmpA family protein, partial [Bacteroidota bacterium]